MLKEQEAPLIGITSASIIHKEDKQAPLMVLRQAYYELIIAAGGIPVLISNSTNEQYLAQVSAKLSGLLLTGGGDIHPSNYGEEVASESGSLGQSFDLDRDRAELFLIKRFLENGKPILGICRGHEIINVAHGGTLIQNVDDSELHFTSDEKGGWYTRPHSVEFIQATLMQSLATTSGTKNYQVNSMHHQAIKTLGSGLKVAAISPDGTIEAIESTDMENKPIVAVQWHPEQMRDDVFTQLLVGAFISMAASLK